MNIPSYVDAIGELHPNVQVMANGPGNDYDDLIWLSGNPIPPKEVLEESRLILCRNAKIAELSEYCEQIISGGFISSALGDEYRYDSQLVDQINLMGSLLATMPSAANPNGNITPYKSVHLADGKAEYRPHTFANICQVLADGATWKLVNLQKFFVIKQTILQMSDMNEIIMVQWP